MKVRFQWICDLMVHSNQSWETQKSLSFAWIIFCYVPAMHSLSFCCILIDSLLLLAFHYGICKSFITTERGNFLRFKEKRNRTHGLKAVEEKQPQKITFTTTFPIKKEVINPYTGQPCSSSKDKRQYACFSQITLQILFHCIQLHDLSEKPQNTRVQALAIHFAWHWNKCNEGHLKRYIGCRSPIVFPVHMNRIRPSSVIEQPTGIMTSYPFFPSDFYFSQWFGVQQGTLGQLYFHDKVTSCPGFGWETTTLLKIFPNVPLRNRLFDENR